jgi:hypothetical protein
VHGGCWPPRQKGLDGYVAQNVAGPTGFALAEVAGNKPPNAKPTNTVTM